MDLVHRLGGLDVPARSLESLLRRTSRRAVAAVRAVPATALAPLTIHYRYRNTQYRIEVIQSPATDGIPRVVSVRLDGAEQHSASAPLVDDGRDHLVEVRVAARAAPPADAAA